MEVPTIYKAYILEFPLMIHIVGDLVYKNGEFPVRYVSLPATVGCTDFQAVGSVLDTKEVALRKTPGPTVPVKAWDDAGKMGMQMKNC